TSASPISGATNSSYTINPATTGANYGVVVTASACSTTSNIVALTITSGATWIGGHSGDPTDWNQPLNWCGNAIPLSTDDVTIPSTANNPLITGANAVANSVTLSSGAILTMTN